VKFVDRIKDRRVSVSAERREIAMSKPSKIDLGRVHAGINLGLKVALALLIVFIATSVMIRLEADFPHPITTIEDFINIFLQPKG
jgi:hypothetical protein